MKIPETYSIDEIDADLVQDIAAQATRGRQALERFPHSPYEWAGTQNQRRGYEKAQQSPETEIPRQGYEEMVGFDGPGDASNPFGVVNHWLQRPVKDLPTANLNEYLWDIADQSTSDHPGRMNGFTHPDGLIESTARLDTYMEYALGYEEEQFFEPDMDSFIQMVDESSRVEDYLDELTPFI
ncbi:MAG: hypothetical protein ABEJ98_04885 [Candidatus Nanohaloarchaea archaeon]